MPPDAVTIAYAINKVCRRINRDPEFRLAVRVDPESALRSFTPALDPTLAKAFLEGDVAELAARGAHRFLLQSLAQNRVFGLDRSLYVERLRQRGSAEHK